MNRYRTPRSGACALVATWAVVATAAPSCADGRASIEPAAAGRQAAESPDPTDVELVGDYELHVSDVVQDDPALEALPSRIRLLDEPGDDGWSGASCLENLDAKSALREYTSLWYRDDTSIPEDEQQIILVWTTGYEGISVELERVEGTRWQGEVFRFCCVDPGTRIASATLVRQSPEQEGSGSVDRAPPR